MSNMSYCRFENTLSDLRQIYRTLCDEQVRIAQDLKTNLKLSKDEYSAASQVIELCNAIAAGLRIEI